MDADFTPSYGFGSPTGLAPTNRGGLMDLALAGYPSDREPGSTSRSGHWDGNEPWDITAMDHRLILGGWQRASNPRDPALIVLPRHCSGLQIPRPVNSGISKKLHGLQTIGSRARTWMAINLSPVQLYSGNEAGIRSGSCTRSIRLGDGALFCRSALSGIINMAPDKEVPRYLNGAGVPRVTMKPPSNGEVRNRPFPKPW